MCETNRLHRRQGVLGLLLAIALLVLPSASASGAAPDATLLSATFDGSAEGFVYVDDAFGTSQPGYASGSWGSGYGYSGGGLRVLVGGVDANTITGMSGGWTTTLNLADSESGVLLTFRYRMTTPTYYEYDEYSRVLVKVDETQYGRGAKPYVDHIGGDGDSTGPATHDTEWHQQEVYLGDLSAGSHTLVFGAYNSKKNASNEQTTAYFDDVLVTSGNAAPAASDAQQLVNRVDINQFLGYLQGVAQFDDRCRLSGCDPTDYYDALAWAEGLLQGLGYTTVRHNFNYNGNTGTNLWATKVGTVTPTQMYMISGHLDGRGGGDAFDDDGSAVALLLEIARVLSSADVTTDKSVRFLFWDKEEVGLYGSYGYVQDRRLLQGSLDEPTWLGLVTHDMILYDHGVGSVTAQQSPYADLDVEWRDGTTYASQSMALALGWRYVNGTYSTDYPANAANNSTNTDDTPFHNYCPSISVRENRRGVSGEWINPYYHKTTDVEGSYARDDDADGKRDDIELGYNAVQATLGLIAELAGAHVAAGNHTPVANPQSVMTPEDTPLAITLTGSDPDGDPITFEVTSEPAHGTLSGDAPHLTYAPAADYNGPDAFTFVANDGHLTSSPATVSISVTPVNDPPVAYPQSVVTQVDAPVAITLTAYDPDGDPLTFITGGGPTNGVLSGTPPSLTYTPAPGYVGPDSFLFLVRDATTRSPSVTVKIKVSPNVYALPFVDTFEANLGWTVNPDGTDTAIRGRWQRGDPEPTALDGPKQLDAFSGDNDLVTGRFAGSDANSNDIDGGVTSIRSPMIQLPDDPGQQITLSFRYYLSHGSNSSSADYFRVQVVGSSRTTVLELRGSNSDVDAAWAEYSVSLDGFAGQQVYLLVQAADLVFGSQGEEESLLAPGDSLVEAAIDDVSIVQAPRETPIIDATFDADAEGFAFADDPFRGTAQPAYSDGAWASDGGHDGGALRVVVGGVDNAVVEGMSGGWARSFSLPEDTHLVLSLWYNLTQSPDYESDEYSQALLSVDGTLYGVPPTDYLAQIAGNGNGGIPETTGWRLFQVDLGTLPAGDHSLVIGGYNNRKSYANEWTEVLIDDVLLAP
ncbi:MAG TPA: Ig-like domain-containing protein [Anaerolineae bacterium]|nr:Ig-like domain-containing protein [Anaerolineae bacterium]